MVAAQIGADERGRIDSSVAVECYLAEMRDNLLPDCSNLRVLKRGTRIKNKEFMDKHRYNDYDVRDILRELRVWNYYETIEKQGCPDAYAFGYYDSNRNLEIYLKFSMEEIEDERFLNIDVISFHDPEREVKYAYLSLKPAKRSDQNG